MVRQYATGNEVKFAVEVRKIAFAPVGPDENQITTTGVKGHCDKVQPDAKIRLWGSLPSPVVDRVSAAWRRQMHPGFREVDNYDPRYLDT